MVAQTAALAGTSRVASRRSMEGRGVSLGVSRGLSKGSSLAKEGSLAASKEVSMGHRPTLQVKAISAHDCIPFSTLSTLVDGHLRNGVLWHLYCTSCGSARAQDCMCKYAGYAAVDIVHVASPRLPVMCEFMLCRPESLWSTFRARTHLQPLCSPFRGFPGWRGSAWLWPAESRGLQPAKLWGRSGKQFYIHITLHLIVTCNNK